MGTGPRPLHIFFAVTTLLLMLSFQNCSKAGGQFAASVEAPSLRLSDGETGTTSSSSSSTTTTTIAVVDLNAPVNLGVGLDGNAYSVAIKGNGIFVGGDFSHYKDQAAPKLVKIDHTGEIDTQYMAGIGTGSSHPITHVRMVADGDLLIVSNFVYSSIGFYFNGVGEKKAFKLNPDGSLHTPWNLPLTVATEGSDQILSVDSMTNYIGISTWNALQAFDFDGRKVFGKYGGVNVHGVAAHPTLNKLFVCGRPTMNLGDGGPTGKLLDFTPSLATASFGLNDPTYLANAGVGAGASTGVAVFDPEGQYVVFSATTRWGGTNYTWNNGTKDHHGLYKVRTSGLQTGREDSLWNPSISVTAPGGDLYPLAIDTRDRVYVNSLDLGATGPQYPTSVNGQQIYRWGFFRLAANGSLDYNFSVYRSTTNAILPAFDGAVSDVKLVTDDKIVVVGNFTHYRGQQANHIVILHADGTPY